MMYRYEALNAEGEFVEGDMQQPSEQAVVEALLEMDFIPLRVMGEEAGKKRGRARSWRLKARRLDSQALFENLHDYLASGLSIDRALELESRNSQSGQQRVIQDMLTRMREGESLSRVMSSWPELFPPVQVGIVRVGEETDSLEQSLGLLSRMLADLQVFRERIRSALAYPSILIVVMLLSMVILFTAVIPKFKPLFTSMGVELQGMTRAVIGISDYLLQHGSLLVLLPLLGLLLIRLALRSPGLRRSWSRSSLKLPLIGPVLQQYNLYLFSMMMQVLMQKRITVIEALGYLKDGVANELYRDQIDDMAEQVSRGSALSETLREPLFPEHFTYLVRVGEETERLADAFTRLSTFYYKQLNERIKSMMTYIEPTIILLLGLAVGLIVVSMLQTLLSINELVT